MIGHLAAGYSPDELHRGRRVFRAAAQFWFGRAGACDAQGEIQSAGAGDRGRIDRGVQALGAPDRAEVEHPQALVLGGRAQGGQVLQGRAVADHLNPLHPAFAQHLAEGSGCGDHGGGIALHAGDGAVGGGDQVAHRGWPVVIGAEHAAGADQVRPRIAHLHHHGAAQDRSERHARGDGGQAGGGGDDDVGAVAGAAEVARSGHHGVGRGHGLVDAAAAQAGAVGAEPDAQDRLPTLALRAGADGVLGCQIAVGPPAWIVGRSEDRDAVALGHEALHEGLPSPLGGADLRCVVVGEEGDVHAQTPPGLVAPGRTAFRTDRQPFRSSLTPN